MPSDKGQPLDENPNWEGGRTVTSHGYILVKKPDHPDADTRGYVYEHRLVAEEKIGRRLKVDEQVHHKNGDKQDNNSENLEVLTAAEHRERHRENDDLRSPGEPNPTIECACGCGESLKKYDEYNRPREYLSGHNPEPSPTQDQVLQLLEDGPARRSDLIESVGTTENAVASALTTLKSKGEVENPKWGIWCLPEHSDRVDTEPQENPTVECACGCGETFLKYDDEGREREYVSGHNTESPVTSGVIETLSDGPSRRKELADQIGTSRDSVGSALRRLKDRGLVEKADGWGEWKLTEKGQQKGGESDAGE